MSATTHNNYQKLPAGPVDWVAVFNDLCDKAERGRTLKATAAVALVEADPFYIDAAGKAAKATAATAYAGLWQSASTAGDAIGYGQTFGIFTKTGWTWTKGGLIYVNSSSQLTQTPTSKAIGVALSETEILMFAPGSTGGVSDHVQNTDQYLDYGGENEVSVALIVAAILVAHAAATAGTGISLSGQEVSLLERHANLTLYPEYPGAVMVASGSNNDGGTMGNTSDSEVVSNVRHNYYEWKSSVTSGLQSYDVVVQIPIPHNFTGFPAGASVALTLDIKTEENSADNNKLDLTINRDGQATTSALTAQKSATAATWEIIGFDETDSVLAAVQAGETLNVVIRRYSQNSKYVWIGKINLAIKVQ
jgi:hypothetical protein